MTDKWESILANDFNPIIIDYLQKGFGDYFAPKNFKPYYVSKEKFFKEKENGCYVKYLWSFKHGGTTSYIPYDKEKAKRRRLSFEAVISGDFRELKQEYDLDCLPDFIEGEDYFEIRKKFIKLLRLNKKEKDQFRVWVCEGLQTISKCKPDLEKITYSCESYENVELKDGDIVYCDIPYKNTRKIDGKDFDTDTFLDWAAKCEYPIYISSYEIDDNRFKEVWSKERTSTLGRNNFKRIEKLYTVK